MVKQSDSLNRFGPSSKPIDIDKDASSSKNSETNLSHHSMSHSLNRRFRLNESQIELCRLLLFLSIDVCSDRASGTRAIEKRDDVAVCRKSKKVYSFSIREDYVFFSQNT